MKYLNNEEYYNFIKSMIPLTNKRVESIPVFYQRLIEAKSKDEIINVIENSIQNPKKERIYMFAIKYYNSNYEKIEKDILNKFKIYDDHQNMKRNSI